MTRTAGMLCLLGVAALYVASARTPALQDAAESITEADIARRIHLIADDSMGGRATPSPGLTKTANYIASEFQRFGLTPGGDSGSFLQSYAVPDTTGVKIRAPNVVGILEGSDPALRNEYLVFSAHMDHVGTAGEPGNGCRPMGADSICNGADDDGSGTVGVVELAEAFSRPGARPKRSVIFLTVSGEEKGLWGSDWFAGQPPVPATQIVANLNIDMIGRNWKDTVVVIGKEHSDLGRTLNRVNARHPELNMVAIDDPWPLESFFTRSDHYNFARRGVPALFFFSGVHEDYHEASDSPDKIDAEKESRIVKLIFYLGQEVANAAERPAWRPESYRAIVRP